MRQEQCTRVETPRVNRPQIKTFSQELEDERREIERLMKDHDSDDLILSIRKLIASN